MAAVGYSWSTGVVDSGTAESQDGMLAGSNTIALDSIVTPSPDVIFAIAQHANSCHGSEIIAAAIGRNQRWVSQSTGAGSACGDARHDHTGVFRDAGSVTVERI
jgi:hypothetical protein